MARPLSTPRGVDDTKLAVTGAVTVKTHASGDAGIVEIFYL
jgi:hypothetical protein